MKAETRDPKRSGARRKGNKRGVREGDGEGRGPDKRGPREVAALPGTLINLDPIFGPFSPCSYYAFARTIR